jgi:hypothetical protein
MVTRVGLVIIFPFLWVTFLLDIAFGDIVTGVKTTTKDKCIEHKQLYLQLWREGGND